MKPILFNTEMVRAILEGRKTVTRRVIKPRNPIIANQEGYKQGYGLWIDPSTDNGDKQGHIKDYSISPLWNTWKWYIKHYAPYQVGDILYVRETFAQVAEHIFWYRATPPKGCENILWKPSIHMPKEAARIFLKVTDVRVERLQDMKTVDFQKEGMQANSIPDWWNIIEQKFRKLWDSTVPKKDLDEYGWNANPWVWVIEFERTEKEDKENV